MTLTELRAIAADIRCSVGGIDWGIRCDVMGDGFFVQLRYIEPDISTENPEDQHGRKWYVSSHSVESEVVQTILKAALTSAEHIVREHFTYKGERIFTPHWDIAALIELSRNQAIESRAVQSTETQQEPKDSTHGGLNAVDQK